MPAGRQVNMPHVVCRRISRDLFSSAVRCLDFHPGLLTLIPVEKGSGKSISAIHPQLFLLSSDLTARPPARPTCICVYTVNLPCSSREVLPVLHPRVRVRSTLIFPGKLPSGNHLILPSPPRSVHIIIDCGVYTHRREPRIYRSAPRDSESPRPMFISGLRDSRIYSFRFALVANSYLQEQTR